MRQRLDQTLALELAGALPGFITIRHNEGEWIEAAPGGWIKILSTDAATGAVTYLAKLSPGFSLPAHPHPVGEECLMLEGDLRLGDVILKAGDFHYAPPGVTHGRLKTENGALVLLRGILPV